MTNFTDSPDCTALFLSKMRKGDISNSNENSYFGENLFIIVESITKIGDVATYKRVSESIGCITNMQTTEPTYILDDSLSGSQPFSPSGTPEKNFSAEK